MIEWVHILQSALVQWSSRIELWITLELAMVTPVMSTSTIAISIHIGAIWVPGCGGSARPASFGRQLSKVDSVPSFGMLVCFLIGLSLGQLLLLRMEAVGSSRRIWMLRYRLSLRSPFFVWTFLTDVLHWNSVEMSGTVIELLSQLNMRSSRGVSCSTICCDRVEIMSYLIDIWIGMIGIWIWRAPLLFNMHEICFINDLKMLQFYFKLSKTKYLKLFL